MQALQHGRTVTVLASVVHMLQNFIAAAFTHWDQKHIDVITSELFATGFSMFTSIFTYKARKVMWALPS